MQKCSGKIDDKLETEIPGAQTKKNRLDVSPDAMMQIDPAVR